MYRTLITPRQLLGAALLLTATSTLAAPRVLHTFGAAGSQRPHLPPSYLTDLRIPPGSIRARPGAI